MPRVSKEQVEQVRDARWAAFERMARELPNHHILAIELLRTQREQTLAVFTAVKDRKAVQYVLVADAKGGRPRPVVTADPCHPPKGTHPDMAPIHISALALHSFTAPMPPPSGGAPVMAAGATLLDDPADPASIALGVPPPKDDPPPGIVALGTVLLASTFDLGEQAT